MMIYSIYGDGFGNPEAPKKDNEINEIRVLAEQITDTLKEDLTLIIRIRYEIQNLSDSAVAVGIGFNFGPKTALSIRNVKYYDDEGTLKYISQDFKEGRWAKEISPQFRKPLLPGERTTYTLEYERPDLGNNSITHSLGKIYNLLEYTLVYPENLSLSPRFLEMSYEDVFRQELKPAIERKDGQILAKLSRWTPSWEQIKAEW
jgi:hypothetical protein